MELSPGERVTVELETGERVSGEVPDPHHPNLDYPKRTGKGQVKVALDLDPEDAGGLFYGSSVVVTAYHGDKDPGRQEERTVVESYRQMYGDMVGETDRADVVAVEREPMTDGGRPSSGREPQGYGGVSTPAAPDKLPLMEGEDARLTYMSPRKDGDVTRLGVVREVTLRDAEDSYVVFQPREDPHADPPRDIKVTERGSVSRRKTEGDKPWRYLGFNGQLAPEDGGGGGA